MNYVTTNIRISEEDYLRLKQEAARKRTSFSAIIREKVNLNRKKRSEDEIERIMARTRKLAKRNAAKLKGFDMINALREMRYENDSS